MVDDGVLVVLVTWSAVHQHLYVPPMAPIRAQVRKWVNGGGKLKVGGDVLVGLSRWETLVPKTKETDQLLKNMPEAGGCWGMSCPSAPGL